MSSSVPLIMCLLQIPDSPLKSASIKLVDQFVYTTIMAAVSTAWRSAVAAANALKDSLSAAIKEKLTPIFEAERTLKDRVCSIDYQYKFLFSFIGC